MKGSGVRRSALNHCGRSPHAHWTRMVKPTGVFHEALAHSYGGPAQPDYHEPSWGEG
jgi:hypothetical protein